ncbi:MAG TPA: amidohydrolase family protein [Ferruginibacter sp.]|nr:amidohydrolase family protein [Ferruginibacter sp.]
MVLANVDIVGDTKKKNIHITSGLISAIDNAAATTSLQEIKIEFDNAIAFPGLINSHDHLDFNLFPQLGNHIYNNYVEWGNDIHEMNKVAINAVLKIPKPLRIQWGVYKNVLNGVTTVVNHGEQLVIPNPIITVFQNCYSLHSAKLEKRWKYKLNRPFANKFPFAMHIGEGTDNGSHDEIDEVIRWNWLRRKMIGIHGVAMNEKQAASFDALVWCPDSNFFLLGATAPVNKLKESVTILFGTDSTVSADWNTWRQLRLARAMNLLTDKELIDSITELPAAVWQLNNTGALKETYVADIVIAKRKNNLVNDVDAFFAVNPEDILLIVKKGAIILFDESLRIQLASIVIENYSKIAINNTGKYVTGNLPLLMKEIKKYNPDSFFPIEIE